MRVAVAAVILIGSISQAHATTETLPQTLTATSPSGTYQAILVPGGIGEAGASLEVRRRGRILWRAAVLWSGQGAIAVSDDGHLATIDDRPLFLGQHSVVIYDPRGTLVVDDALKDFLLPEELRRLPPPVLDQSWRYTGDEPAVLGAHLFVTATWGATIVFRLEDGKVTRDSRRFGRLTDYLRGALPSDKQSITVKRGWGDGAARDACTLSAAGCRCQRTTVLDAIRGPGPIRERPLARRQWKALLAQAAVLVPLVQARWERPGDRTKVEIELSFRRKHAGWDRYTVVLEPAAAQGEVARLVEALLDVTGL